MPRQQFYGDDRRTGPALCGAVEAALKTSVLRAERMRGGHVNRVYRVETALRPLAVKIYTYREWPEDGKPQWLEERLTRARVPHAALIHYSRGAEFFPHGFAVFEFIAGRNCQAALLDGSLLFEEYCRRLGVLLRQVHAIKLERFGYVNRGAGTDEDFVEAKLTYEVRDRLREVDDPALLDPDLSPRIEDKVVPVLASLARRFASVLVHADAVPGNAILTEGGGLVLVDWDEAVASIWLEDLSKLSYWHSYLSGRGGERPTRRALREAFIRGYGETDFTPDEVALVERALHVVESADLLSYYYKTENMKAFGRTRETLTQLLK